MKAGGQGAEPPVEGEVSGKRPKRKCLQWHPLLSKKTLDFSEDEEEEDEEEPEKSQGTEGGAATEEEEDDGEEGDPSERRARRPMNAFLLFCKRHRSVVRQEHPRLDNRGATKILADWWAVLDPKEKQIYTDMAKEYKDAFMKANPGYKWCPPSNKSMKTPSSSAGSSKKAWPFLSEPSKDCATPKKLAKAEGVPQIHFSMADPTKMGGLSMLLFAGERALTAHEISPGTSRLGRTGRAKACANTTPPVCHPPEVSIALQGSLSEGRQCGQSALFQLAEMCLASEANKTVISAPRPGGQSTRGQARVNQGAPLSSPSVSSCPSSLSASSTPSEDASPRQGQLQILKKKKKKKKKKNREGSGASKVIVRSTYPPSKPFKRSPSSESDLESLIDTIDAVAKGSWCTEHDRVEPPAKKPCPFSNPSLGKRKSRPIERKSSKPQVDEVVEEEEDHKPVLEGSPETKGEGEVPSVRDEAYACALMTLAPSSPSAMAVNNDDKMAAQLEHCGSRKSERSCKGALYKTLVSEGMLTSLRASVDRGRRTSGRGSISDLEGNWAEDGCADTQLGGNNSKKLKKAKLKEEHALGLGKLEEQFEKKFNCLPQYSPLTFDRKTTCLTRKKKSGVNRLEDLPIPLRGSSPSLKKNSFHKIISKYKNRKEQPATMDKAMETRGLSGPHIIQVAKPAGPSPPPYPESPGGAEALVGSQKRKARKRKITHLLRTADGRVSPPEGDQARETLDKELGPSTRKMLCNKERSGLLETCVSTTLTADRPGESGHRAFFSLAALAEVAAMENVQRGQHSTSLPQEGQSEEIAVTHVLISCGNQ